MDVKTFITNSKKRKFFTAAMTVILNNRGNIQEGSVANVNEATVLSKVRVRELMDNIICMDAEYEFPLYENQIVNALKIVAEERYKNIMNDKITSVSFKSWCVPTFKFGEGINAIIDLTINAKILSLQHFSYFSGYDAFQRISTADISIDKIFYDGELVLEHNSSHETDKLRDENFKLKNEAVFVILIKFLPRDLVFVILGFRPLDYRKLERMKRWFKCNL